MLNRIRTKNKSEPLNQEDQQLLCSRLISKDHKDYPKSAIYIAPTHKQLDAHNNEMLQYVAGDNAIITIEAADICFQQKQQKTFRRKEPAQNKDTSLIPYVSLCTNTRIMLTTNIDVTDGLTNGAMGTVTAIIKGTQPLGQPEAICVRFDNVKVGANSRMTNPPPSTVDQNSTVMKSHKEIIQRQPYQITRHQYPFVLSRAVTIHKVQGMTVEKAVVSLKHTFKAGMAYVALSRITTTTGLFLLDEDFDPDTIYSDPKVNKALLSMPSASTLEGWKHILPTTRLPCKSNDILIVSHNVEGLFAHMHDIKHNEFLACADIIAFQETWIEPNNRINNPFPNHDTLLCNRHHQYNNEPNIPVSLQQDGRGGVALFVHRDFNYQQIQTSHIGLECVAVVLKSLPLCVFNVYRPPTLPLAYFCNKLNVLLQMAPTTHIVLTGDFNVDLLKNSSNQLTQSLRTLRQLIAAPTTKKTNLDRPHLRPGCQDFEFRCCTSLLWVS